MILIFSECIRLKLLTFAFNPRLYALVVPPASLKTIH